MKKTKKSKLIFRLPLNLILIIILFYGMLFNWIYAFNGHEINFLYATICAILLSFISIISILRIKIVNLILGLKGQLPLKRFYRNFFITGNAWGMFHINSHVNANSGKPKQMSSTKEKAEKAARSMEKKYLKKENKIVHFSVYKCVFCDGWHIGKNRDNK